VNAIEDRLRDAYRAAAETVGPDSVPDLSGLPAADRARTGRRGIPHSPGGQRWRRLAIPVAAAVAVSLIATTAWLARPGGSRPSGLGPAIGGSAPAPPFIVGSSGSSPARLTVYRATTGQVLARIPAPGRGLDLYHTAATRNDRVFVVAAARTNGGCYTLFYRLLLTRSGRLASMTRLAVPRAQNMMAYGVAASADGMTIAYTAGPCDGGHGQVGVLHVGSQAVRTWSLQSEGALSPSLSPDGRLLYFVNTTVLGGDGTVRALRTDAPPGPVARRARVMLSAKAGISESGSIALARHGQVLLACSVSQHVAYLSVFRPATGTRFAVSQSVHSWPHVSVLPCTITVTPDGSRALVSTIVPGIGTRVDLATGRARPIPGSHRGNPPEALSW
jgi:hypothetical protein